MDPPHLEDGTGRGVLYKMYNGLVRGSTTLKREDTRRTVVTHKMVFNWDVDPLH